MRTLSHSGPFASCQSASPHPDSPIASAFGLLRALERQDARIFRFAAFLFLPLPTSFFHPADPISCAWLDRHAYTTRFAFRRVLPVIRDRGSVPYVGFKSSIVQLSTSCFRGVDGRATYKKASASFLVGPVPSTVNGISQFPNTLSSSASRHPVWPLAVLLSTAQIPINPYQICTHDDRHPRRRSAHS